MNELFHDIGRMCMVQGALWAVVLVPPAWALWRRLAGGWPVRLVVVFLAGVTSQAVLGFLWSLLVQRPATAQAGIYLAGWLLAGLALRMAGRPRSREAGTAGSEGRKMAAFAWALLLIAAAAIRLLHPLRTWALGQSDAYTHLAMFREILAAGRLSYAAYPPGYAWIMTLPSAIFGIDPYHVARFGGAMFGIALVLAVNFLMHKGAGDRPAGLAAAALAGFFPGLALLHKTGVGCFANQAGLMLLPMVWSGLLMALRPTERHGGLWLLASALAALALTVPMMLLHITLVAMGFLLLYAVRTRAWQRARVRRFALPACGLALVAGVVLWRLGADALNAMAIVLTRGSEAGLVLEQDRPAGFFWPLALAADFFRFKRWGAGGPLVNAVLFGAGAAFAGLLALGYRRGRAAWMLLGCWGALSAVQAGTGVLQFTAYQREGWSFMVALACLGGLVTAECWRADLRLRPLILGAMALCVLGSVWRPPAHDLMTSVAEEQLVRIARMLRAYPDLPADAHPDANALRQCLLRHARLDKSLTVMTRPFMQEHLLPAVAGPNPRLRFPGNVWLTYTQVAERAPQILLLLESPEAADSEPAGLFSAVSPESAEAFARSQRYSYAFAGTLAEWAETLPPETWQVERCALTGPLGAWYLRSRPAAMDDVP